MKRRSGDAAGNVVLDPAVFELTPNVAVMHQVVVAQLAAARAGDHSTLTRAEVAGGGRKPWRQKGSGRARQGSVRAPHWRGGGVAMGPKPRSYRQRTPKKMVQLALRSALSDRAAQGRVAVVEKSFRNLPDVSLLLASELNAYDVLCSDWVVFTRATLPGEATDAAAATPPVATLADRNDWDLPVRGESG